MQKYCMLPCGDVVPRLQKSLKQVEFEDFGGKNMNEYDYTGDKMKNHFTAYLQKCIRWKRWNYLKKKEKICRAESPLEESLVECGSLIDEILELRYREEVLSREQEGRYPGWNELSDQRLTEALLMLHEDELRFIYQHVFEERTFKEIGCLNGIKEDKVKNIYYYAIYKIRKWMGGNR